MRSNQTKLSIADDIQIDSVFNEKMKINFSRSYGWLIADFSISNKVEFD